VEIKIICANRTISNKLPNGILWDSDDRKHDFLTHFRMQISSPKCSENAFSGLQKPNFSGGCPTPEGAPTPRCDVSNEHNSECTPFFQFLAETLKAVNIKYQILNGLAKIGTVDIFIYLIYQISKFIGTAVKFRTDSILGILDQVLGSGSVSPVF
jgi:hypothetical protein